MRNSTKKSGRPPAYNRATVLAAIRDRFWEAGFSATSLDDLSAATGLARPSLYGGFGDKQAMYRAALAGFRADAETAIGMALSAGRLRDALTAFYAGALDIYTGGAAAPRGCFVLTTATAEALSRPEVRDELAATIGGIDAAIHARLMSARDAGELPQVANIEALTGIVSAGLHSLAIRARAGETRAALDRLAKSFVDTVASSS
jgi:TetR/AcrR family transcriptional regulator, copper-responsive repressor